ncbi:MAG: efflux RND transporter periplasmic adaptor subunit [Saprospiraceae bacterium]
MDKAKTNLGYADIYSPISGVILSRDVDEGQTVAASLSTPTLFTIAEDLKKMQVEANVDEADIGEVSDNQRVEFTVDAYQGIDFAGKVTQVRLNPTTTSNVVTYTVVIDADNEELKLKPGMTATITIYTQELKNVLTVESKVLNSKVDFNTIAQYFKPPTPPSDEEIEKMDSMPKPEMMPDGEIVEDENTRLLFVMEGNEPKPRRVKFGLSDDINVQVVEGLNEGDKVLYKVEEVSGSSEADSSGGDQESPFMPKPPGRNKK